MGPTNPVSVRAVFNLPQLNDIIEIYNTDNCASAAVGLPENVVPSKLKPGDFSYSGMHDNGQLPCPKEGGHYALLMGCVSEAKIGSDKLLTKLINDAKETEKTNK